MQIINDQRENSKRKSEKDFDLDMDMGRMKKKRRNAGYNGEQRDNPNYNAFQEHQRNQRPSQQHHRRGSYGNCNGSYAYRISYTGKRKYWAKSAGQRPGVFYFLFLISCSKFFVER